MRSKFLLDVREIVLYKENHHCVLQQREHILRLELIRKFQTTLKRQF